LPAALVPTQRESFQQVRAVNEVLAQERKTQDQAAAQLGLAKRVATGGTPFCVAISAED
jgi:hypothetical protein